jgi:hypothetical protein
MGMILWTVGIIALALKINHDEAKAHTIEPPDQNITVSDTARVDSTITIHGDTARVKR